MTDGPRFLMLVADYPWPMVSGGRVRAAGIIEALRAVGSVEVLALDYASDEPAWERARAAVAARYASRRARGRDLVLSVVHGFPTLLERSIGAGAVDAFERVMERVRPDVVVLCRPFVGPFLAVALERGTRVVVDADESLIRANRSIATSRVGLRQRVRAVVDALSAMRIERARNPRCHQLWVSSDVERAWFLGQPTEDTVHVIRSLAPGNGTTRTSVRITALAFVGYYQYPPNEEAALELMTRIAPAVRAAGGPATVHVVGRAPTDRMRRAASEHPDIRILGEVPDSTAVIRDAGVLVVPVRSGAGTRVKVLEAMQASVPVVSTIKGVEGLAVVDKTHYLGADTPEDFARQIRRLEGDAELRASLTGAARGFVEQHHSSPAVEAAVREALAQLPGLDLG